MLVLSRQRDQSVVIGNDIQVHVVDIRGDKVRLGFVAPRHIAVHRKEVFDEIRAENESAAKLTPKDLKPNAAPAKPIMRIASGTVEEPFLQAAIEEARASMSEGGLPIGAVLVRAGEIIGRGRNRVVQSLDPLAHAELACLSAAGRQPTYRDATLYITRMPCLACSGAAVQCGIQRIIVGDATRFSGVGEVFADHRSIKFLRSHGVEVVNSNDRECAGLMSRFIRDNPGLWINSIER